MKLGVFINQDFYIDGMSIRTTLSFIKFIESFSTHFEQIIIFAPSQNLETNDRAVYKCSDVISLCSLPYYEDVRDLFKRLPFMIKETSEKMKPQIENCDVIWIVGPHPLALLAYRLAKKAKVPIFMHIRGNILEDIKVRFKGKKYLFAKAYAYALHYNNIFLCKRMPVMVVGSKLYDLYAKYTKDIYCISPSMISKQDIDESITYLRTKPDIQDRDVELIFVGRVEPEKGISYLFEALRRLNNQSQKKYKLTLIGAAHPRGRETKWKAEAFHNLARELGIEQFINWIGYVPFGRELFNLYRKADFFILPSLSEGIPKVLYEAMAAGLPIITTSIGGIPDIIKNEKNGLLILSGSTDSIIRALQRLLNDRALSKSLIEGGFQSAEEHTMERARDQMMEKLIYPYLTRGFS